MQLTIKVKVTDIEGKPIPEQAGDGRIIPAVSVCNDFMNSLMRKIELYVNGVKVGSDHNFHPHISVIKNILCFPKDVGESILERSVLWNVSQCFFDFSFALF